MLKIQHQQKISKVQVEGKGEICQSYMTMLTDMSRGYFICKIAEVVFDHVKFGHQVG